MVVDGAVVIVLFVGSFFYIIAVRQRLQAVAQRAEFCTHTLEKRAEGGFALFAFLVLFVIAFVVLIILVDVLFVGGLGERVLRGRGIKRRGGFLNNRCICRFDFRLDGSRRESGLFYNRLLDGGFSSFGHIGNRPGRERLFFANGRLRLDRRAPRRRFGRGLYGLSGRRRVHIGETGSLRTGLRHVRLGC